MVPVSVSLTAAKSWWHMQQNVGPLTPELEAGNADQDFENLEVDVDVNDFHLAATLARNLSSSISGHTRGLSSRRTCVCYSRNPYVSGLCSAAEGCQMPLHQSYPRLPQALYLHPRDALLYVTIGEETEYIGRLWHARASFVMPRACCPELVQEHRGSYPQPTQTAPILLAPCSFCTGMHLLVARVSQRYTTGCPDSRGWRSKQHSGAASGFRAASLLTTATQLSR